MRGSWPVSPLSAWWPAPAHFLTRPGSDFTPSIIISDRSDSGWYDCYNSMQPILISIWDKILDLCTILTNQRQVLALWANQRFPFSISAPSCLHPLTWAGIVIRWSRWNSRSNIFQFNWNLEKSEIHNTINTSHTTESSRKFSTCLDTAVCCDRGLDLD